MNEILNAAINIDCEDDKGETPLFKAISNGNLDCVEALLKQGANIKTLSHVKTNVLHVAAENGRKEILRYLLDCNDDTRSLLNEIAENEECYGAIHFAASNNHADCVELLVSKKANICFRTKCPNKSTSLHIAAAKNHIVVAKVLLKNNTIINEFDGQGWSPLHVAAKHCNKDIIILLLREGADLSSNSRTNENKNKCSKLINRKLVETR